MAETHEYVYDAKVERVVDGDTIDIMVDLGFRTFQRIRVRLYGVDTPETFGVKKESEEYQKGVAARKFVEEWCGVAQDPITGLAMGTGRIIIRSHDGNEFGQGKYGRWLVEVLQPGGNGQTLNDALVEAGHAERKTY